MVVEITGTTAKIISFPKPHDPRPDGQFHWTAAAYYTGVLSPGHVYLTDIKETDKPNTFSCKGYFWVGMNFYNLNDAGSITSIEPRGWIETRDAIIVLSSGRDTYITVNLKNKDEGTLRDGWVEDTRGGKRELLGLRGADNSYYNTEKHYSKWPDGVDRSNILGTVD